MNFSLDAVKNAQNAYRRLLRHAAELRRAGDGAEPPDEPRARFRAAISDDLNTPQALAVTWDVVRSPALADAQKWALLRDFDQVLGLDLGEAGLGEVEVDERIEGLIREREASRAARDFARADQIRDELAAEGVILEDSPEGTTWHRA